MSSTEDRDDNTRVGLWVTFGAAFILIVAVVAGVVVKQMRGSTAAAPAATFLAAEEVELVDAPLEGELMATLYFDLASANLPADAATALAAVQQALGDGALRVMLSGFHDASGDPAFNRELAKQRALSVRQALLDAGVQPSRVQLRRPESTTGDGTPEEARRVELRLVN